MKSVKKIIITMMIVCTFVNGPKALGWWNLIYTNEEVIQYKEDDGKIRFFFLEWFSDLACKFK